MDEIHRAIERGYEAVTGRAPTGATVDVLAAQVATETGYGASMVGFNFGGIKGSSPEGKTAVCKTHEVLNGQDVVIHDAFRAYDSAESGATDYVRLLERRFPQALDAASNGDVEGFARALKAKGYFTADEGAYARAMRGAMGASPDVGAARVGRPSPVRAFDGADASPPASFATSTDLARVVDAIATSALRLSASETANEDAKEP
ncbi:MAG: glucosaminidase domain-containing protein [Polyangiaceae bacterium]